MIITAPNPCRVQFTRALWVSVTNYDLLSGYVSSLEFDFLVRSHSRSDCFTQCTTDNSLTFYYLCLVSQTMANEEQSTLLIDMPQSRPRIKSTPYII